MRIFTGVTLETCIVPVRLSSDYGRNPTIRGTREYLGRPVSLRIDIVTLLSHKTSGKGLDPVRDVGWTHRRTRTDRARPLPGTDCRVTIMTSCSTRGLPGGNDD